MAGGVFKDTPAVTGCLPCLTSPTGRNSILNRRFETLHKSNQMGTHITILEAVLISGVSLFVYVFIKSLIQHFKSK